MQTDENVRIALARLRLVYLGSAARCAIDDTPDNHMSAMCSSVAIAALEWFLGDVTTHPSFQKLMDGFDQIERAKKN
jgi:hypothetical protein